MSNMFPQFMAEKVESNVFRRSNVELPASQFILEV